METSINIVNIAKLGKDEQMKVLSECTKGQLDQAISKTIYLLRFKWSLGERADDYKIVLTSLLNALQGKYFI